MAFTYIWLTSTLAQVSHGLDIVRALFAGDLVDWDDQDNRVRAVLQGRLVLIACDA